jgi:fermentation-respiration switch protein FrsA (DUF1100 family)
MTDKIKSAYLALDRPEVSMFLFHPRAEMATGHLSDNGLDILIPVADEIHVGARFHIQGKECPNLLFFHGNGEIVADYDDLGPLYNQLGINFLPVDYRGYGRSNGQPTVTTMLADSHKIFVFVQEWFQKNQHEGPLVVMGRSLGSAPALELSASYPSEIQGLIIESGFAFVSPLLKLLGIDPEAIGFKEEHGFRNLDKIRQFIKPTLIIHAEFDHIIPYSDGQALYSASPAAQKELIKIESANHNDIFFKGMQTYMQAIQKLVGILSS